jgi:competence protein CoiA
VNWAEQRRLQEIAAEQLRQRREAEEHRQREEAAAAEQTRLRQEQFERQQARQWWDALSTAQMEQLCAAVSDPVWTKDGIHVAFDTEPSAEHGHGIAIHRTRRLYGVLRPSPVSLHRLPPTVPVFVRNAREARLLTDTGLIEAQRIVHFDLPKFEQLSLT